MDTCSIDGCPKLTAHRGLCALHYMRWYRHGDPNKVKYDGRSNTAEYKSWACMRQRCRNIKSQDYPSYGGRGITICKRWDRFENFLEDMGPRPSRQYSIDRIDNDGSYSPKNCRWATPLQQANNQRPRGVARVKGVSFHSPSGKWRARKSVDGKRVSVGLYDTVEEAAAAL